MAAPAAAIAAKAATRALGAQLVQRARRPGPPPPPKHGRGILKTLIAAAVAIVLAPALIVAVLFGGAQPDAECAPDAGLEAAWTRPGSLGGVAGTGVTRAELTAARRLPGVGGTRLTPGTYSPTAYFPNPHAPATNCASTCTTTASGIRVNNATRRAYLIASNPRLNQYGALAYIWPNPYGWTGPFVVADTGSAFQGTGRLDFYIFLSPGESWQQALGRAYQWGPANQVRVFAAPIRPGGPTITTAPLGPTRDAARDATPAALAVGACGSPVAPGPFGALTGTPEQIVNRVVLHAREHGFPDLTPATVRAANDAHSPLTTAGHPSDHKGPPDHAWAADISNGHSPTAEMDTLAAAIATAFEIPWEGSGLVNHSADGYRLQLIYRAAGHYDHVHLGVKRLAA